MKEKKRNSSAGKKNSSAEIQQTKRERKKKIRQLLVTGKLKLLITFPFNHKSGGRFSPKCSKQKLNR